MRSEKLQARIDKASSRKAELEEAIKGLESEVAELDAGMAEATKIRNEEHASYVKASTDFKDAATAVEGAIKVLKDFYEGQSFIQIRSRTRSASKAKAEAKAKAKSEDESEDESDAPEFGGAKSDAAHAIMSILEMSLEDFTKLLMEVETAESEAQGAFDKLMTESKVSKAAKE